MTPLRLLLASALALTIAAPAFAQTSVAAPPPAEQVIRLSPEQKDALIAQGSEDKVDAAQAQALGGDGPDRRIHGEVGFMIGTGGARGVYGVAAIPLGDNATAVISYENTRWGNNYRIRR